MLAKAGVWRHPPEGRYRWEGPVALAQPISTGEPTSEPYSVQLPS